MADNAEVKLGADVGGLKSGMEGAAASARENLGKISDAISGLSKGSESATSGIVSSFSAMSVGVSLALAAVGAAILAAIHGIDDLKKEAESVEQLRQVFGMTSAEASRLDVALQLIGKTSSDYSSLALHLARAVKTDEERMRELGLATRDAAGNLLPMEQLQRNAIATMQTYRIGVDQNMVALELWGRSAKDVYGYLKLTDPIMERAAQLQRELGIEMGPAKRAEIEAYNVEVRAIGVVWSNVREALGEALMPVLKMLASWFATTGIEALRQFGASLITFANEWTLLSAYIAAGVAKIANAFDNAVVRAQAAAMQIKSFTTGNWSDLPKIAAAANERLVGNNLRTADKVVKIWDEASAKIAARTAGAAAPVTGDRPAGGGRGFVPKEKGGKAAADDRLAIWKDELIQMQEAQGYFNELSKAQEADFWRDKLALVTTNGEADVKLRRSLNRLIFEDSKAAAREALADELAALNAERTAIEFDYGERIRLAQVAADRVAAAWGAGSRQAIAAQAVVAAEFRKADAAQARLADIAMRRDEAVANHAVDMEQMASGHRAAMQEISAEQALAADATFENARFRIAYDGFQKRLALEKDPEKIAAILAQIEALEMTHEAKMTEIANKAVLERQAAALAANDAIRASASTLLSDIVTTPNKWRDAWQNAVKSVQGTLTKLASDNIIKALFGPGTTGGDWLSKLTGIVGGVGGKDSGAAALTTAGTMLQTAAAALQTAAGAMGAGGAAGGAGGLFGSLFSGGGSNAGQGYGTIGSNIPDGPYPYASGTPFVPSNQLAFLHKGEAVIPAGMNKRGNSTINMPMNFHFNGPVSSATQSQVAAAAAMGAQRVMHRDK